MENPAQPNRRKLYCNRCDGDTNHEEVWMGQRSDNLYSKGDSEEDGPPITEITEFRLWRCIGCEAVLLEQRYGLDIDDEWRYQYHPKPARYSVKAKYFTKLPERLSTIYKEAVICFNSAAWTLCAIGLRALIEGICRENGISGKTIEKKIDGLKKVLPESIVNNLHSLRFMGNQAAHELEPPSGYDLAVALEICEDLLNYLYELDYKTSRLAHWKKQLAQAPDSTASAPAPEE
ncbi:MAG: DUF4145 domain-containing protein [Opitutae bacterium]|nr:DUF4145 domain-containing protein [Opitutae bacterium]